MQWPSYAVCSVCTFDCMRYITFVCVWEYFMVFTEMLMCKIPFPYYVCSVTLAKVIIERFEYVCLQAYRKQYYMLS